MTSAKPLFIAWAKQDDAPLLVPLLSALYQHDVPDAPAPSRDSIVAHVVELLVPTTPHRLAIAWAPDGQAVGLAAVAAFVSISDPRPERRRQMELKELFVCEDCRSAKIGSDLMAWVEAEARAAGACRIDWHVKQDNTRGIAFYRRHGAGIVDNRLSMRKLLLPAE
jgi:GNAT superfamily N-acetyltransferase